MREQQTRAAILELLDGHGGLRPTDLCQLTGKGWGNVTEHLRLLNRHGYVDQEQHGRESWAFHPRTSPEDRSLIIAQAAPGRRELMATLAKRDPATITELSNGLQVSRNVIRTHLSHLMVAGAVERHGRPPKYRITELLRRTIK